MSDISISSFTPMQNYGSINSNHSSVKATTAAPAQVGDSFSVATPEDKELTASILKQLKSDGRILEEKTQAFPDDYGRVKHLALQLSNYASGPIRSDMLNAYKTLFTEMEPDTKFTIVVGSDRDRMDVENIIHKFNVPNPDRIQFIKPDGLDLTVWARDQMISMYFPEGDGSKTAITNFNMLHNWHDDDEAVPQYIVNNNPSIVLDRERRLVTDGGEVVSNRGETFIGAFSIMATANKLKSLAQKDPEFAKQIKDYAEEKMGMKVNLSDLKNPLPYDIIPKEVTPGFHEQEFMLAPNPRYQKEEVKRGEVKEGDMWVKVATDLFEKQFGQKITPMGMDDPTTPRIEGPANDHLDMGLTPLDEHTMAIADPSLVRKAFEKMSPERRDQVASQFSSISGHVFRGEDLVSATNQRNYPHQQEDFDAYAAKLEKEGYRVIRTPYAEPSWGTPNISFNNCLMERFTKEDGTEVKRIFLPVYGIDELDKMAISTYEKEGFEVHPMPLAHLAVRKGALRCMSQWLNREQYAK